MNRERSSGYTLRDILHVLFKRKWTIALLFLGTLATAIPVLISNSPRLYEATAQILLGPGREHLLDLTLSSATTLPPRLSFDLDEHAARTVEMLTSRYLSEQLVQALGARGLCREMVGWPLRSLSKPTCDPALPDAILTDAVVMQVRDNIRAERVGHAALINVSFRHDDPVTAAKVVNTLGALYLDRHLGVLKNARGEAFVQEQAETLKQRLVRAEKTLEDFKRQNEIGSSLKDDRETLTRQIELLQAQQVDVAAKQAELTSRIAKWTAKGTDAPISGAETSPTYDKLVALQQKESEMAIRLGDRNPDLIALREEIHRARDIVIRDQLARQQIEVNGWRARQASNQPKLNELRARLQRLDRVEVEFNHLQQQAQAAQQDYRLYTVKQEESRITSAMDEEKIASVRVIEPARPPMVSLPSTVKLKAILAALFGLFAGVAGAFTLELFNYRLDTPDRIETALHLPVLVAIPDLRSKLLR
jgi:uncharacterized protein involved in exopolysaccharide biosynthesis